MRIACPNCSAEYDVPDSLLAAGPRMLRCARCKEQFEAALPGATPDAVPELTPQPTPEPTPEPAPEPAPEPPAGAPPPPPQEPPPALPEAPPAAPPPVADPDRPPPTRGPTRHSPIDPPVLHRIPEPEPPRSGLPAVAGWVLSLALIGGAAWATYTFHAEITALWPPAARLYQALGIH